MKTIVLAMILGALISAGCSSGPKLWQTYEGGNGPGKGKRVVLISGDEEYRSEEALPQLGKILALRNGFDCTVLFAQDPKNPGVVDPNYLTNIPGLEALRDADLMIIATRFRDLPDEQMAEIERYLLAGKPVIGIRTATHGFKIEPDSKWAHWSFDYKGDKTEWHGGFGEFIMGTSWVSHHGWHKYESTRGIVVPGQEIGRGIAEKTIWGPSDVYGVKMPQPADYQVVAYGQVLTGMNQDDAPIGPGPYEYAPKYGKGDPKFHKNEPMMPLAWTKPYALPGGKTGKVFSSTLGAASDFAAEGSRRLIVNAAYWCVGLEVPKEGANVDLVGQYEATMYGNFKDAQYWQVKGVQVTDFDVK